MSKASNSLSNLLGIKSPKSKQVLSKKRVNVSDEKQTQSILKSLTRQGKENTHTHKSPLKHLSQTKSSCPDLWASVEKWQTEESLQLSVSAEMLFDKLFPSPNIKRVPYYSYQMNVDGVDSVELFEKLQQNDWIDYNYAGTILEQSYVHKSNPIRTWFDKHSVNGRIELKQLNKIQHYNKYIYVLLLDYLRKQIQIIRDIQHIGIYIYIVIFIQ